MRKALVVGVYLGLFTTALADEQPAGTATSSSSKPLGVEFSLRLGPALTSLSGLDGPMFPLWLGLGYRIHGVWYVGISGVYSFGSVFSQGSQVTITNAQFLVEAAFHPLAYGKVDPWVGYGIGAEWLNGGTAGFVPVSFDFGVDFAVSQSVRVGPFFAVQVAFSGSDNHQWYIVGLKLTALP